MSALQFAIPKGRMHEGVMALLSDAGIKIRISARAYRPELSIDGYQVKIMKPQNIVEMLHHGTRDIGFAGADWVREKSADLVELIDTGLDRVRIVAAAPPDVWPGDDAPKRKLVVASEYQTLTREWIDRLKLDATLVRSYGATEVFPPEDADLIVDNTATGSTLRANGLRIVDTVMQSSTRLYANPRALEDNAKRERIETLQLLLTSVLEARSRVMIECNVPNEKLDAVIEVLPCMREPTIAALHHGSGHAVKAAVPRTVLPTLIPEIKARGGSDIVVSDLQQIVP
ncbi:MAG: ATP phosphoribosyltransferase [Myxococcota bacterium]